MMIERIRNRLLALWFRVTCGRPGLVLLIGFILTAMSIWVTADRLVFQSDRNAMISPEVEWNARFMRYARQFADFNSLIVAVRIPEGADGPARARLFADDLARRLESTEGAVHAVWHRFRSNPVLLRIADLPRFQAELAHLEQSATVLRAGNLAQLFDVIAGEFQRMSGGSDSAGSPAPTAEDAAEQMAMLEMLMGMIGSAARGQSLQPVADAIEAMVDPYQYLETDDGALLLIQIDAVQVEADLDPYQRAVGLIREALAGVLEEHKLHGIEAGLTGLPVMEVDEANTMMADSALTSIVAGSAVALLMVAAFGGWRLPLLMIVSLLTGVAWSFGFLTVAVGHLQLLSVFFTVILLGMGIDFAIHIVSGYELERPAHEPGLNGRRVTLKRVMSSVGPGLLTGALTSAAAFASTLLTDFKGMSEMGLIAGVGLLLCLAAMLFILPAFLLKLDNNPRMYDGAHRRRLGFHGMRWIKPLLRRPVAVVVVGLALLVSGAVSLFGVRYDNNLLELYPENLDSVRWQNTLLDHSGRAVMSAASLTDGLDEARRRALAFASLDLVGSVGGIGLLFPPDEQAKLEAISAARARLAEQLGGDLQPAADAGPATAAELAQRLTGFAFMLNIAANRAEVRDSPPLTAAIARLRAAIASAQDSLGSLTAGPDAGSRMASLHRLFISFRDRVADQVRSALDTRPLTPADLPPFLHRRAVSDDTPPTYLVEVTPKEDVWEPAAMAAFVEQLRTVDPQITGVPVQVHESGLLIQNSYKLAGFLAGLIALAMVWWDFGRLTDALLAMTPVTFGFLTMFGIMWLTGETLNPANIIVLPLMFGIGIAAGVHVLHRYRQAPLDFPPGLTSGTDKAIILTNLTTILAFASMLLAHHRGIRSLGFVLSIGVTMTLIGCLTLTPALLVLRNRLRFPDRAAERG